MNRRQALSLLATGAAMHLAPAKLFALRQARAMLATQPAPHSLGSHRYATVAAMAELILPRTETPGATDVGVADFVDLIVTEWYDEQEQARFLAGLGEVDTRSSSLFGKLFLECTASQQADILFALGANMRAEADDASNLSQQRRGSPPEPQSFYYMLRGLTLTAYYTSEAGATSELDFKVIPDRYDGCNPLQAGKGETS